MISIEGSGGIGGTGGITPGGSAKSNSPDPHHETDAAEAHFKKIIDEFKPMDAFEQIAEMQHAQLSNDDMLNRIMQSPALIAAAMQGVVTAEMRRKIQKRLGEDAE